MSILMMNTAFASVLSWDVSSVSYANRTFDLSGETSHPGFLSLQMKSDGAKMYMVEDVNDRVVQYSLSTPWNVDTASYDSVELDISGQDSAWRAICFSPDGKKMYLLGGANDTVYQYTLSTAWDLSTATYASKSFSFASQDSQPISLHFSPDLSKMYMGGLTNDTIYQYTLSTPGDVSTASFDTGKFFDYSAQTTANGEIYIRNDGLKLFISSATNIYQYSLSTAWDISTSNYDAVSADLSAQMTGIQDIFFQPTGERLYASQNVGVSSIGIFQYDL